MKVKKYYHFRVLQRCYYNFIPPKLIITDKMRNKKNKLPVKRYEMPVKRYEVQDARHQMQDDTK